MNFKKLNNITGWFIFLIATVVYVLTVEPTASFWDCGEFIACAYKLQVPHPPGAPLFLLIGRMFSFLAFGDVTKVAYWVNMVSVLSSSFTVLFLFWSITLLAKRLFKIDGEPDFGQKIAILGAGAVGALAYTFSDSFWFSAVEAEVYAISSFFTAFVVWAMLKWESIADEEGADKWLVLIAYMVGLSIGVHLLNLVTIPALACVYYFKRYTYSLKGILIALGVSGVILVAIMNGVIVGLPSIGADIEIFFVNALGLPFSSGIIFFCLAFVGALVWGIRYSIKKKNYNLNLALVCFAFILLGDASYGVVLIRSNFNPPIDENNPENILSFVSYLKREQYGDRPLLYGPHYTAELQEQIEGAPIYRKKGDKYVVYDHKIINKFDPKHETIFPRMHSKQGNHIEAYLRWAKLPRGKKPTMKDNLFFFFRYQIGHMYLRYFFWNFAGRESDIQDADWLRPWDSTKGMPDSLSMNKARNQFFMLPLILGILGLFYQFNKDKNGTLIVGMLWFLTGIAMIMYLNQPPTEPRERDYIFAGSTYAFAFWIGYGVLAIADFIQKFLKKDALRYGVSTVACLAVPGIMAAEGWDDHSRANRWHSVDSAKNLLNSCAKNAVLFTGGDNDTFPLWYVQEVEGFRTDVRVCNLSLLNTDWYIEQMKRQAYDSDPLPISLEFDNFIQGKNDYLPFVEKPALKGGMYLKQYLKMIKEDNRELMVQLQNGGEISTLPTNILALNVDTHAVNEMKIVPNTRKMFIVNKMVWDIGQKALEKKDLIMLDMIATNEWKRPIYFSTTLGNDNYLNLREYMQMEGLAYRLLPAKVPGATDGYVNTDIMYERMMKGYTWRNLDNPNLYYDENQRRFPLNLRSSFYRLAEELVMEQKYDKAKEVIHFCLAKLPDNTIPYDYFTPRFVPLLLQIGDEKTALDICKVMGNRADQELAYFTAHKKKANNQEIEINLYVLNQIVTSLRQFNKNEEVKVYEDIFKKYETNYQQ
jgi:hypothetical protein